MTEPLQENTNNLGFRPGQTQTRKQARDLKEEEGLYYLCSNNKGADHYANIMICVFCFCLCMLLVFSCGGSIRRYKHVIKTNICAMMSLHILLSFMISFPFPRECYMVDCNSIIYVINVQFNLITTFLITIVFSITWPFHGCQMANFVVVWAISWLPNG